MLKVVKSQLKDLKNYQNKQAWSKALKVQDNRVSSKVQKSKLLKQSKLSPPQRV